MTTKTVNKTKPQQMAEGVRLCKKFSDSTFFAVSCDCGSGDHEIDVFVEKDEDLIFVTFSVLAKTKWWEKKWDGDRWYHHLWNGLANRLSLTYSIWVKGYADMYTDAILTKQTAVNFANAIQTEVDRIENDHD